GLIDSASQMGEIVKVAKGLGDQAGVKTAQAIEILTDSVAGLNEKGLRRGLKLQVDFKGALLDAAIASDRTLASYSEQERTQIALSEALTKGRAAMEGNAQTATQLGDRWERFKASLDDARTEMGDRLAPTFSELLKAAQPVMDGLTNFLSQKNQ